MLPVSDTAYLESLYHILAFSQLQGQELIIVSVLYEWQCKNIKSC